MSYLYFLLAPLLPHSGWKVDAAAVFWLACQRRWLQAPHKLALHKLLMIKKYKEVPGTLVFTQVVAFGGIISWIFFIWHRHSAIGKPSVMLSVADGHEQSLSICVLGCELPKLQRPTFNGFTRIIVGMWDVTKFSGMLGIRGFLKRTWYLSFLEPKFVIPIWGFFRCGLKVNSPWSYKQEILVDMSQSKSETKYHYCTNVYLRLMQLHSCPRQWNTWHFKW